jgi:Holliday junction resolvasome RuvABC endonuclease subunit
MERTRPVTAKRKQYILVCDPSMCAWGYVIIDSNGVVWEAECIKTGAEAKARRIRKGDDRVRRVTEINQELIRIIKEYDVDFIVSELPHGSQNASAAVMIGNVMAMVQTIGDCMDIAVEWYSEGDAKKALLNKRSATKGEVIEAISKIYTVPWKKVGYKDEAIADAMAIYHLACQHSQTLKYLQKKFK